MPNKSGFANRKRRRPGSVLDDEFEQSLSLDSDSRDSDAMTITLKSKSFGCNCCSKCTAKFHGSNVKPEVESKIDTNIIASLRSLHEDNEATTLEPLVSIKFRDKTVAEQHKGPLLLFLRKQMKLNERENIYPELEIQIWDEDLCAMDVLEIGSENYLVLDETICTSDGPSPQKATESSEDLFVVDAMPDTREDLDVPAYSQRFNEVMLEKRPDEEIPLDSSACARNTCFNCDGDHMIRDCPLPRDNLRISKRRQAMAPKMGRYHMEDEQRFSHLRPGRISAELRAALGQRTTQLPLYIYRMRLLGYPPGWLEDHKVMHSGISMFDSKGKAVAGSDDEDGEIFVDGARDKYDVRKVLSFPGFNVPPDPDTVDESHYYGVPPMTLQHSKEHMLSVLAPNAAVAYKKRPLKHVEMSSEMNDSGHEISTDMEVDDDVDEEIINFIPPLPDLPPLPVDTPPPMPDEAPPLPPPTPLSLIAALPLSVINLPSPLNSPGLAANFADGETPNSSPGRSQSPSLSELEAKKRLLLEALDFNGSVIKDCSAETSCDGSDSNISLIENNTNEDASLDETTVSSKEENSIQNNEISFGITTTPCKTKSSASPTNVMPSDTKENVNENDSNNIETKLTETKLTVVSSSQNPKLESTNNVIESPMRNRCDSPGISLNKSMRNRCDSPGMSLNKSMRNRCDSPGMSLNKSLDRGHIRSTSLGTPILKSESPFSKLPNPVKFSKDITDVINFENLPDSTGAYEKMKGLLSKVRHIVKKINDDL